LVDERAVHGALGRRIGAEHTTHLGARFSSHVKPSWYGVARQLAQKLAPQ
jgi:hypothetical protein